MKKFISKLKSILLNYISGIKKMDRIQKIIYFSILFTYIFLLIKYTLITIVATLILAIIVYMYVESHNKRFVRECSGNGIIAGGRGKGKGLLLNKRINADGIHFCNVPYNEKTIVINIKEYIDSIAPNTTDNFITSSVEVVKKIDKFEGRNIYWDDVAVYAPNYMDSKLKKHYPSLSALLPINRHLYNAFMIITIQDFNRPYKILRELQIDFGIKAIKTVGGYDSRIWNAIPILRHFIYTKYIYYENVDSAQKGLLPFNAKSLVTESLKHGYLTAGQATKEEFEAVNGKIRYGFVIQRKSVVKYDTRYFHKVVFGESANEALKRIKNQKESE